VSGGRVGVDFLENAFAQALGILVDRWTTWAEIIAQAHQSFLFETNASFADRGNDFKAGTIF